MLYYAYFLIFEATLSTTPGKWVFSLQVRHLDGSMCAWKGALLRTVTRFLEVNPFLLGAIPAAIIVRLSRRGQRWGDMLARTTVVSTS
jgi:uncharacterized RDD family membrane protein YckC